MARRPLSLSSLIEAVAAAELKLNTPREDGEPNVAYHLVYVYCPPGGHSLQEQEITADMLVGKTDGDDEWPLPGTYKVEFLDSNNNPVFDVEPLIGIRVDKDSLARGDQGSNPAARAMGEAFEDLRIQIRDQRARINEAERREEKARKDLQIQLDIANNLQRAKNEAESRAAKAVAEMDLARQREEEARQALEEFQEENEMFRPQLKMLVDEGAKKLGEMFGGGAPGIPGVPAGNENGEPLPDIPGIEDARGPLSDLYEALISDLDMLDELMARGVITWETLRALTWLFEARDIGVRPEAPPAEEPQQAAEGA